MQMWGLQPCPVSSGDSGDPKDLSYCYCSELSGRSPLPEPFNVIEFAEPDWYFKRTVLSKAHSHLIGK